MLPEIEIDEHFCLEPVKQTDLEWQVCKHFEKCGSKFTMIRFVFCNLLFVP